MSEKIMKVLHFKGKLTELKSVENNLCGGCIFGKRNRVSFSKIRKEPKARKLELIHTDVCGPSTLTFLGGSNYCVIFIDDSVRRLSIFSKINLIFFMPSKDRKQWSKTR